MISLERLVELIVKGILVGKMLLPFKEDVQLFARSMDSNVGYLEQTDEDTDETIEKVRL